MFGKVDEVVSAYDKHMNPRPPRPLRKRAANQAFVRRKTELRENR